MKKTFTFLFFAIIMIAMAVCFTGCNNGDKKVTATMGEPAETPNAVSDFVYEKTDSGVKITKYIGSSRSVVIPEEIEGTKVTEVVSAFFEARNYIEYVSFPSGVTEISRALFGSSVMEDRVMCPELKKVKLREGVTKIGEAAFKQCPNLTEINLPSSLRTIEDAAFQDCVSLKIIDLPAGLESIGYCAFQGCSSLKQIKIPGSVGNSFGNYCFALCGIEELEIGDGITVIPGWAFSHNPIKSITIPQSVRTVEASSFEYCTELEQVSIGNSVETISGKAFEGCEKLREVIIPESLRTLDECAFLGCTNLEGVKFEGDAPDFIIDEVFGTLKYNVFYHEGAKGFEAPLWNGHHLKTW